MSKSEELSSDVSDSVTIPVYLITHDPHSKESERVHGIFKNENWYSFFAVKYSTSANQPLVNVLKNAKTHFPGQSIIVLHCASKTILKPYDLHHVCSEIVNRGGWDICYLSTFSDKPEKYSQFHKIPGSEVDIVKVLHPTGFQAVILSPSGQHKLLEILTEAKPSTSDVVQTETPNAEVQKTLSDKISKEHIVAYRTYPNVIDYDVSQAKTAADYRKANLAAILGGGVASSNATSGGLFSESGRDIIWVIVIIIIVIVVIGVAVSIYQNNKKYNRNLDAHYNYITNLPTDSVLVSPQSISRIP